MFKTSTLKAMTHIPHQGHDTHSQFTKKQQQILCINNMY